MRNKKKYKEYYEELEARLERAEMAEKDEMVEEKSTTRMGAMNYY